MPTFTTTVELGGKTATGLRVPPEVVASLGDKQRVSVTVTINGYTYRSTVAPYSGAYMLPLSREHREAAGVAAGDEVEVTVELDTQPRVVELPDDLAAAIASDQAAADYFEGLSHTNRKEYVRWVTEAKRDETRQRRITDAVRLLAEGRPRR